MQLFLCVKVIMRRVIGKQSKFISNKATYTQMSVWYRAWLRSNFKRKVRKYKEEISWWTNRQHGACVLLGRMAACLFFSWPPKISRARQTFRNRHFHTSPEYHNCLMTRSPAGSEVVLLTDTTELWPRILNVRRDSWIAERSVLWMHYLPSQIFSFTNIVTRQSTKNGCIFYSVV